DIADALLLVPGRRLDRHDPDVRVLFAQVSGAADDRARGAQGGDEDIDLAARLLPDLGAGRLVMGFDVDLHPVLMDAEVLPGIARGDLVRLVPGLIGPPVHKAELGAERADDL